jgi:hypothetical protein
MKITESELLSKLAATPIPEHMCDGLVAYIINGRPVGDFLTAILSNDLKEACSRADNDNQKLLYDYVFFLYNSAPAQCWGGAERYARWIAVGGMKGIQEAAAAKLAEDAKLAAESAKEKA